MRIGVDAMGGDFAPAAVVAGAAWASRELPPGDVLVLYGDREQIEAELRKEPGSPTGIEVIHCAEVIGMGDNPAKTFAKKSDSSIVKGFMHLAAGAIDGFASAGNTGAMMVGAMYAIKSIPGIIRPAIATYVPVSETKYNLLLDVGLNPDCRPEVLYQYAILGQIFSQLMLGIASPRIGLLNIGEEEEKGNLLTKSTYELMKDSTHFRFAGNVEGHDIFSDRKADVVVCDGFVGNVILKEAEAIYHILKKRGISDPYFDRFNFEIYGGTPILGINAPVIIAHGKSTAKAIKNMILQTQKVVEQGLCGRIKEAFA